MKRSATAQSGTQRWEAVVLYAERTETIPLPDGRPVTVGRDESRDVRIDDASISRQHALVYPGEPVRIEDLGSASGTQIVERAPMGAVGHADPTQKAALRRYRVPPQQPTAIPPGAMVELGSTLVLFRRAEGGNAAWPSAPRATEAAPPLVIRSPLMLELYQTAKRVAPSELSVLLLGETGVGKEVVARTIWRESARARRPLLCLNCGAFTETLLESELFGHERGAFTGATEGKRGLLEEANGGTVFLDEIGDMSLALQVKLLRVVEQRQILPVGARAPRPIDVRFICATNRDLEADVTAGRFRRDLFFRIAAVVLSIPPLADRPAEIEPLARAFLARAAGPDASLSPPALERLRAYRWPGNVRELEHVIERAALLTTTGVIEPEHLAFSRLGMAAPDHVKAAHAFPSPATGRPVDRTDDGPPAGSSERDRILWALERCVGNQTRAARLLGISRTTLVAKLEKYNLPRPRK